MFSYLMWLSASLLTAADLQIDPVQTQLSSIPVQQADAEPPEKQRQIQVMAKRPVFNAQLYTFIGVGIRGARGAIAPLDFWFTWKFEMQI